MELNYNFLEALKKSFFNIVKNEANYLNSKVYLIGGFVRDHLLNRQYKKDIDIVVVGSGIELAKAVQKKLKGAKPVQIFKTYGTAMIKYGEINLEFVGSRKESYDLKSRNPKVMPGTLDEDQKRRDFTINAIAVSLNNKNFGDILDPFNGIKDLKKRIITETDIQIVNILSISKNTHRIILGPYNNINSLQKGFYSIRTLGFENIEIIKNG